jgi:ABC-type sugar transport system substrate-binding protein
MLSETIKLVQGNVISATIDQSPEKQSYEAVRLLVDVLKGQQIKSVDTGAVVYDSKNIGDYVIASKQGS